MDKIKVLVIEDDGAALSYLTTFIGKEGFEVLSAASGEEGLEKFKKEKPDVVITDYKMAGLTGLDIMRKVHALDKNVQIIFITAFGGTEIAISAMQEGALDYLKKPIDLAQLLIALGRAKEKITDNRKDVLYPTVLVVDDEDDARNYICRYLKKEKEGYHICSASNGVEAVEFFRNQKVDVLLIDLKMPQMGGIQALHEIRGMTDDFESIILTGHGDESDAIQALRHGTMNFLKKPIDLEELTINIEKALEKLGTRRTLKFRVREGEILKELVGRITDEKKIVVNLHRLLSENIVKFAEEILDALPLGLVLVSEELKILYTNPKAKAWLGEQSTFDEKCVQDLKEVFLGCNLPDLKKTVLEMFSETEGGLKKIDTGPSSSITLMQVILIGGEVEKQTAILMALRCKDKS